MSFASVLVLDGPDLNVFKQRQPDGRHRWIDGLREARTANLKTENRK
jgi:hypothetical protein